MRGLMPLAAVAMALAALAVPTASRARPVGGAFQLGGLTRTAPFEDGRLRAAPALASVVADSWGGPTVATDGERVDVRFSDSYPVDPAWEQQTADFLTQLYHGAELASAHFYIAPLQEVQSVCGPGTGGCYGKGQIIAPGEPLPDGTSAANVLAHEYGHHIAANRDNAPWDALDWGPKRWATAAQVCTRELAGTAFPGDEGAEYRLNPGEAWAETYRLLDYEKQAWPAWVLTGWNVVDQSFYPDAAELAAAQADVLQPWQRSSPVAWSGRLRNVAPKGKPVRVAPVRREISTPLDGDLALAVGRAPAGMTISVSTPGGRVLGGTYLRILPIAVCGQRRLVLTVRSRRPGPFRVSFSAP